MGVTKYFKENGGEISPQYIYRDVQGVRLRGVASNGIITFPDVVKLFKPVGHQIHFFEELTFSTNVKEGSYQTGINPDPNQLKLSIFHGKKSQPVTRKPIDLNQYFKGLTIGQQHIPNNSNKKEYKLKLDGQIIQSADIIQDLGSNDLFVNLLFTITTIPTEHYNLI